LGVGVALVLDQRQLADPRIALAQLEPVPFRQPHHNLASPVHQLGVGREHYRLRLHRGVDDHASEVGRLHRLGPCGDREALLQQRLQLLLPMRWRQRVSEERSNTSRCWKNSSPQKNWKYGFSTQRSHTASSERSCM
jgi:hypothetical protein